MSVTPLIVTHNNFDPGGLGSAYHSMRFGYYHGFEDIGLSPRFVRHSDIGNYESNSLFLLTWDDYNYLDDAAFEVIKHSLHVVMVNVWFEGVEKEITSHGAPGPMISMDTIQRIIDSKPAFVWGLQPEERLGFYEKWNEAGCKVVSLPWGCDTTRYHPSGDSEFENVEMGLVASYRVYKTAQYKEYLWPYEDKLKIWSGSPWPRCYQGSIENDKVRVLYQNATVCPTISEPLFTHLWILPERSFAILGSGGLTVLDCAPIYSLLFSQGEVLMPRTASEYHEMVDAALHDSQLNQKYRDAGYRAVMKRHTCEHRVRKLLKELGNV